MPKLMKPRWEAENGIQADHCRECGLSPLPGRRTSWCSDDCVDTYMVRAHQSYARRMVWERDQGVCAECLLDTREIEALLGEVTTKTVNFWNQVRGSQFYDGRRLDRDWPERLRSQVRIARQEILEEFNWEHLWERRSLWDADHVIPKAEGGPSEMANLQTLCLGCHREKTHEQRRRNSGG